MPAIDSAMNNPYSISMDATLTSPNVSAPLSEGIEVIMGANAQIAKHLERIRWGTDGAIYRLCDYEKTLYHVPGARFLAIRKQGQLVALRLLVEKHIPWQGKPLQAFYHGLFSVAPEEQRKGYGRMLAQGTLDYIRTRSEPRSVTYAFIEAGNHRSLRISESLGYQAIGTFHALWFSRLHPKTSSRLSPLAKNDTPELINGLHRQYQDHALPDFSVSLQRNSCRILRDDGKIMAGLQAEPQHWVFESLGGTGGFLAVKVLPYVPVLGNLFNPRDFRFLKIGNLFFAPGRAEAASELLEATLAGSGRKVALLFIDKKSPIYREWLSKSGGLGILNALAEVEVHVMGRFQGFPKEEMMEFTRRPLSISPTDL